MNSAVIILISDWVDKNIAKPQQTRKKINEMRHAGNPTPPKKITIYKHLITIYTHFRYYKWQIQTRTIQQDDVHSC